MKETIKEGVLWGLLVMISLDLFRLFRESETDIIGNPNLSIGEALLILIIWIVVGIAMMLVAKKFGKKV